MFQSEKAVEVIYDENTFNEFIGGMLLNGKKGKESVRKEELVKFIHAYWRGKNQ